MPESTTDAASSVIDAVANITDITPTTTGEITANATTSTESSESKTPLGEGTTAKSAKTPIEIPAGFSKRAFKRLQKEQATKAATDSNGTASSDNSARESREASTTSATTSDFGSDDSYVEYLQKRIRNLQKRKVKLDKYFEIDEEAKTKKLPSPLNADQRSALQLRDTVEVPLKDLQDALAVYKSQVIERITQEKNQKAQHEAEIAKAIDNARLEGIAKGREQLDLTVKFLRAASFKRQLVSITPAEEINAFEHLLKVVYAGDETSLNALDDLFKGVDKKVDEETETITFKQAKEISLTPPEEFYNITEEADDGESVDGADNADSAATAVVSEPSHPVISFLQEEVTEESTDIPSASTDSPGTTITTPSVTSPITTTSTLITSTIASDSADASATSNTSVPTGPASGTDSAPKKKNFKGRPYYNRNYKQRKGQNQGDKSTPPPPSA